METALPAPRVSRRRPLAALGKLTAIALALLGVAFIYLQAVIIGRAEMPLPVFTVLSFVLAGLITTGFRPLPILGFFA